MKFNHYRKLKRFIREQETKSKIKPASIHYKMLEGKMVLTFHKRVLTTAKPVAVAEVNETFGDSLGEMGREAWANIKVWAKNGVRYKTPESLDVAHHAAALSDVFLTQGVEAIVHVKEESKSLPIPFIRIPIPFTKKRPNIVRDHDTLISQACQIEIELDTDKLEPKKLWQILNQIAMLHTENDTFQILHDSLAERRSHNPLVWLGRLSSKIVPKQVARFMPNRIREMGRVSQYGTPFAEQHISHPVVNWGTGALALDAGFAVGSMIAIGALIGAGCKECAEGDAASCFVGMNLAEGDIGGAGFWYLLAGGDIDSDAMVTGYVARAAVDLGLAMGAVATASKLIPRGDGSEEIQLSSGGVAFFATHSRINNHHLRHKPLQVEAEQVQMPTATLA